MLQNRKFIILLVNILFASVSLAQHPNLKKIDSLKNLLPITHGIQRIDCLNALGEEYWLTVKNYYADTLSGFANLAYKEAVAIHYTPGIATSIMLIGVAESYRKNLRTAEKYLRQALSM